MRSAYGELIASALRDLLAFHEEVIIGMEEMRQGLAGEERNMVDTELPGVAEREGSTPCAARVVGAIHRTGPAGEADLARARRTIHSPSRCVLVRNCKS